MSLSFGKERKFDNLEGILKAVRYQLSLDLDKRNFLFLKTEDSEEKRYNFEGYKICSMVTSYPDTDHEEYNIQLMDGRLIPLVGYEFTLKRRNVGVSFDKSYLIEELMWYEF